MSSPVMSAGQSCRVIVTDQVFPSVSIEREILLAAGAELEVADGTPPDVIARGRDADALLNTYMPIDADLIRQLPDLRIIARYGIGTDNIDLGAAAAAGVVVTNVPDYCVEEVATHTLALMLALVRRLFQADPRTRAGEWGISALRPIRRFSDLTVGLIGYGRIARRLAGSLSALGAAVAAHDPYVTRTDDGTTLVDMDALLADSDIVSLHVPMSSATRGLIDQAAIQRMRPGSMLVNTSRGGLVVFEDLVDGLRAGHLAGAALDVFEQEPPDRSALADVPNLIVTPHMAYYSEDSLAESQRKAATQVVKVLGGEAPDYPVVAST